MKPTKIAKGIFQSIREADPNLEQSDIAFHAAAALLASMLVGPDYFKIARLLNYPLEEVGMFSSAWEKSGTWKNGKVHGNYSDLETGGAEFWLDVAVGCGYMERV